jgi:hypothetical protein
MIAWTMFLGAGLLAGAREKIQPWEPIDPADLRADKPAIDPGAAAEALFWKLEFDDRDFPESKKVRMYIRFKIFDPQKAVDVTRLSELNGAYDGQTSGQHDLRARLTLPDGTSKEFGDESVQERDAAHEANRNNWYDRLTGPRGWEVKERFLAISGIEPGSILEYQEVADLPPSFNFEYHLQSPDHVPVRHLEAKFLFVDKPWAYLVCPFLLNTPNFKLAVQADTKAETLQVAADGLPALNDEPFSPPVLDRSLALIGDYMSRHISLATHNYAKEAHIDSKAGLWGALATEYYLIDQDATQEIPAVKELAASLSAGAQTETERARRIHNYVHARLLRYLDSPQSGRTRNPLYWSTPLDQVIGFEANSKVMLDNLDFFWLAVALYRAAGLRTEVMLLPNRAHLAFSRDLESEVVLPMHGARVWVDGRWQYSMPDVKLSEPFGRLPWFARGSVGLVARSDQVEFVQIPDAPMTESSISNLGSLELSADGGLTGRCRRIWKGEWATQLKEELQTADEEKRGEIVRNRLKSELKCDDVTLVKLRGVDDVDAPLVAEYDLHWRDFAVATKRRLIFRPSVFHGLTPTPFTVEVRRNPIDFQYGWEEVDRFDLRLPPGYRLESPPQSAAQPEEALGYRLQIAFDQAKNQLNIQRVFASNLHHLPASAYGDLKQWYGEMARHDGAELVLIKPRPTAPSNVSAGAHPAGL